MAAKRQFTDTEFLEGLRSSDDLVLTALYKKYFGVVLKYVLNNSGTEEEAQDIYQETVIVLYNNTQKPEFELNCAIQTYIYSVAKRLWLKQLNKNSNVYKLPDNADEDGTLVDVSSEVSDYEEKEKNLLRMNDSLVGLGEPCKTLIEDFYIKHLSMEEISEKFGYTNADNAKNQKYKCLQRLKRLFFNEEGK
ncbi:MAG TPA: sigma-70 family RNA polymerase sigma factor [Bacteroidia bacterium]